MASVDAVLLSKQHLQYSSHLLCTDFDEESAFLLYRTCM